MPSESVNGELTRTSACSNPLSTDCTGWSTSIFPSYSTQSDASSPWPAPPVEAFTRKQTQ